MSILIVDDSLAQRHALAAVLENAGYREIRQAGSAPEALRLLRQAPLPPVNLILMDLHMPIVNGIEACRQIKSTEDRRDIPVIMVTSSDEDRDLEQAFEAGAMDYIVKPPEEAKLLARVRSALKLKRETDVRKVRERELGLLNRRLEQVLVDLDEQHRLLQLEQEKSERLLLNILPKPIAERLKHAPGFVAERFESVTVLFADLVGFTPLSARLTPGELVEQLNDLFSRFDELTERHGLEKIKTIGDAYMAVAGLPAARPDHARAAAELALEMRDDVAARPDGRLQIRIGLHSGPVVAGVIGRKKFSYDLWGDTVNLASRMESQSIPGRIQVTETTRALLAEQYRLVPRGEILVKGKGRLNAFFLEERRQCQPVEAASLA